MNFAPFVKRNGFRHIRCAPYHPASNGLAKGAVQTFKDAMKKMVTEAGGGGGGGGGIWILTYPNSFSNTD